MVCMVCYVYVFFFKQKTEYEVRISDWSSDVCSSDLARQEEATKAAAPLLEKLKGLLGDRVEDVRVSARLTDSPSCLAMSEWEMAPHMAHLLREAGQEIGRASCRERGWQYV